MNPRRSSDRADVRAASPEGRAFTPEIDADRAKETEAADDFQHEKLEEMLTSTGEKLELSRRQFFGVLRVAATGRAISPPLFEMMEVMGKDRTVSRVKNAIDWFS